jgi:hypothetical protein
MLISGLFLKLLATEILKNFKKIKIKIKIKEMREKKKTSKYQQPANYYSKFGCCSF